VDLRKRIKMIIEYVSDLVIFILTLEKGLLLKICDGTTIRKGQSICRASKVGCFRGY